MMYPDNILWEQFTLKLDAQELTEDLADKVFECGCDDALLYSTPEGIFLDFMRVPGETKEKAIKSLLDAGIRSLE